MWVKRRGANLFKGWSCQGGGLHEGTWEIYPTKTRSWTYISETPPNFEAFLGGPGLIIDSNSSHFLVGYPFQSPHHIILKPSGGFIPPKRPLG